MIESNTSLILILLFNSILVIGLILNQNDTSKDALTSQNSRMQVSPIEKITWFSLILQFFLLLIKIKNNSF